MSPPQLCCSDAEQQSLHPNGSPSLRLERNGNSPSQQSNTDNEWVPKEINGEKIKKEREFIEREENNTCTLLDILSPFTLTCILDKSARVKGRLVSSGNVWSTGNPKIKTHQHSQSQSLFKISNYFHNINIANTQRSFYLLVLREEREQRIGGLRSLRLLVSSASQPSYTEAARWLGWEVGYWDEKKN